MDAFEIGDILAKRSDSGEPWLEFLRLPTLSVGVYVLEPNQKDLQQPHTEDEVYYVLSGQGVVRVGDEDRSIHAGSIILVEANVKHHFHSITEELKLLVFFSPPEGALEALGD